jgi:hypothetical protein
MVQSNLDGSFKINDDGGKIIRYDVSHKLYSLTMAEKLLIRHCAPFVLVVHVSTGVTRIQGHCVFYPQNIDGVCQELPDMKKLIITIISKVGGH